MKKGILTLGIMIMAGILFLVAGNLVAAESKGTTTAQDEITIDNKGYAKDSKGAVLFHHAKHVKDYGAKCTDCHHEYDASAKNTWKEGDAVKKCSVCHNPETDQDKAKKLQTAYHANCKDCHKKSGKETAPATKCNGCHATAS
jgi:hypothetical protein